MNTDEFDKEVSKKPIWPIALWVIGVGLLAGVIASGLYLITQ